jgi:hypothetical protein
MLFRVLAFVVSMLLLASSVMASPAAIAAPQQHPLSVLAAVDQAGSESPAEESTGGDQAGSLLDVPDQLAGPSAVRDGAPRKHRMAAQPAPNPTNPDLEGPQRPPRASQLAA